MSGTQLPQGFRTPLEPLIDQQCIRGIYLSHRLGSRSVPGLVLGEAIPKRVESLSATGMHDS